MPAEAVARAHTAPRPALRDASREKSRAPSTPVSPMHRLEGAGVAVASACLVVLYAVSTALGSDAWLLAFAAACWFFHVGADRALGYGPRPSR